MGEFDAIVIGAGHNSLACASHLQKRGWSTAIYERHEYPGGAAKTLELTEPGFRHDFGAMNLNLFAGSAFHKKYVNELKSAGLEFVPVTDCFSSAFPDGRWLGVSSDLQTTAGRIAEFSASDAETWREMAAGFPQEVEAIGSILGSPMSMRSSAANFWKIWRSKGTAGTLDLVRLLLSSPRSWLNANFESDQVKAMMAAWGMHLDFAPDIAGGAVFPYLESMANQNFGMVLGKGGAVSMTSALTGFYEGAGGTLRMDAEVSKILMDGGTATGVRLANGDESRARKAVIANVAPGALVGTLLPQGTGSRKFDTQAAKFAHAPGTMMIHLAMDSLPDWTAGEALKSFAYVHLAPSLEVMARAYGHAIAGHLPDTPVIVVGQPTAVDPSRAPDGKHVLWVQVRVLPATVTGDALGEIEPAHWDDLKERYADRVLDIIESYAPGLRSKILGKAVFSPQDMEREDPNLVGGDQICGSHHLSQNFFFRPVPGYARWNTPVKNLHMVGAATWPGAGVGAASGFMLAQQLAGG